jgi:hypothetical protein
MTKRRSRIAIAALMSCFGAAPHADRQATPQATPPPKTAPATHVTKDQIQEFIAKLPRGRILDGPIRAAPHLWANIEADMSHLVFRPDPDGTLTLK